MAQRNPPTPKKLSAAKQRRLDSLLDKNAEGTITAAEKIRLEALVAEAEQLIVANTRLLAEFSQGQRAQPPAAAVPVTVWVKPEHAGQ